MALEQLASSWFFVCWTCLGRGVGKLYNDVCLCQYNDIHVMWSMLEHSTGDPLASPKGGYRVNKDFIL